LQAYEQARQAANELDQRPRLERDVFSAQAETADSVVPIRIAPEVDTRELVLAFADVMKRAAAFAHHKVSREALSTRERMSQILDVVGADSFVEFTSLFRVKEGVAGVVVSFLAILELVKEGLLVCIQSAPFAPIHVKLGHHEQN
jgi:segregation and condensation protein A